jgi:putative sterol carrier protein
MVDVFLNQAWVDRLVEKLNSDARYAQIASKWEGDFAFVIEPTGDLTQPIFIYVDLWHGTCRSGRFLLGLQDITAAFTMTATYEDIKKVLTGKLDPMQALMIRKLRLQGSMAYMMRNAPTVIDFVRCAREITTDTIP